MVRVRVDSCLDEMSIKTYIQMEGEKITEL